MNNDRKTNIKRFTKATAALMLCTTALNLTITKAHASDDKQAPTNTSATYTSSDSAAVAPQLNNPQNNGNVTGNNDQSTTTDTTTSSSNTGSNDPSAKDNAQDASDTNDGTSPSVTNDTEQSSASTSSDTNHTGSLSSPANVAVSFVYQGQIVGTDYLTANNGWITPSASVPPGYQLQDLSQASLNADATNGVANIPVHPVSSTDNTSKGSVDNNDQIDEGSPDADTNPTSSDNSDGSYTIYHPVAQPNEDGHEYDVNQNDGQGNDDATSHLNFPTPPHGEDTSSLSHNHQASTHRQRKQRPLKQYHHPVKMPKKVLTPKTPKKVNHHRVKHTQVNNPMLRPGNNPDRIRHAKDFKSQVHMNHRDKPKNVRHTHSYRNFDKSVLRYRPMLHKITRHYHMSKYDDLFLAIMEVESKGQGKDVMQSSESAGLKPGSFHPEPSIEQSVRYMKSIVDKAHAMDKVEHQDKNVSPDAYHDYAHDDRILAQAYDYGGGFLDYIAHSKYGYSEEMSQRYSKEVVAKQLGNDNGATYRYDSPISQLYHKNFLYQNGGNYLYADEVSQYLVTGYMKGILNHMLQYRDRPYVFGGKTPETDFDCSGLVSYGFKSIGLSGFPDFTETQWNATKPVKNINKARPGDLIFFKGTYGDKDFISHVGFMIDRHTMFDSNSNGVEFTNIDQPYWREHFAGVRRVPYRHRLDKMALQHQDRTNVRDDDATAAAR